MTAWPPTDDCLTTACQITAWWLFDDCLTTAKLLRDDCLISNLTSWHVTNNCLMAAWWLPNNWLTLKTCPLRYDYQLIDLAKLMMIVMIIGYTKAAREGVGCFPEGNIEFNHDDCSSFLMCNHQRYIKMLCPKMLRFDPTTKTCNLIDRVSIFF